MQQDILVTGAGGFIGSQLVIALLRDGAGIDADGQRFNLGRLIVTDRSGLDALPADPHLDRRPGDIGDAAFVRSLVGADVRLAFHLAGVVSGAAESDFDTGMRINFDGTRHLLEACRAATLPIRFVFSSSIAVFGTPLPTLIDDQTMPRPTLSYGSQKVACEYLINDYARRGLVDGRAVRFPGVVVRPPMPNGARSAFNSDLIREPLAGRSIVSPVSPAARIWVQSIDCAVANLLRAAALPGDAWGIMRAVTLPAVSVTIAQIIEALCSVGGERVRALITFRPNPDIELTFGRWPREHPAARARQLGFTCDADILEIVRNYAGRR